MDLDDLAERFPDVPKEKLAQCAVGMVGPVVAEHRKAQRETASSKDEGR